MTDTRQRLMRFADECEALARRSISDDARARYHRAAIDARRDAAARFIGEAGMRLALAAAEAQARFAAWEDGAPSEHDTTQQRSAEATVPLASPPRPVAALSPPKLAAAAGMSRRGALKVIERGHQSGLPGFHCEGRGERRRWFADQAAFDRLRASSQ